MIYIYFLLFFLISIILILVLKNIYFPSKNLTDPFRLPTEEDLDHAEKELLFNFPKDYRTFLKAGGDTTDAKLNNSSINIEPLVVFPGFEELYLIDLAKYAWDNKNLPKNLLPFIEYDNGYFCITELNEVILCSEDGQQKQCWPDFKQWCEDVCGYSLN